MPCGRILSHEVPAALSDETVAEALAQLQSWRLEKALAFKRPLDRYLCAEAFLLLKKALREAYGLAEEFTFVYGPAGKPALKEHPEIHFNLSHCGSCVCCIVSSSPVGIDVEDIQYDPDLARAVCNAAELEAIADAESPDIEFTRLWTMKESFLKLTGEGMVDDLKNLLSRPQLPDFDIKINAGHVMCSAQ